MGDCIFIFFRDAETEAKCEDWDWLRIFYKWSIGGLWWEKKIVIRMLHIVDNANVKEKE